MQTKEEIAAGLSEEFEKLAAYFARKDGASFTRGPEGKWTCGQHLDHLIRSTTPLNTALKIPRMALRARFGKPDRPSDSMEGVVATYEDALAKGGAASGQFIPEAPAASAQGELIEKFRDEGRKLVELARKWKEEDLDRCYLPHPLIGNLTAREMLFFTVHHMRHHLATLQRDYA